MDSRGGQRRNPYELTDESPVYVISVAAQLSGLHPQTLRQYDRLGLVSPDRTLLIGSSHRSLAVSEKTAPGDGTADASQVYEAANVAANRLPWAVVALLIAVAAAIALLTGPRVEARAVTAPLIAPTRAAALIEANTGVAPVSVR